jgi:hypothetical protein
MKSKLVKETAKSRYKYRTFVAWPENEQRLALASRLGINVSELINEALKGKLDDVLKKKTADLQEALKMVRDTGFEPVTPTVSR